MSVTSSFSADLRCPDDGHLLQANDKGAVAYATCRHCDGLWFTKEAIESKKPATLPGRSNPNRGNVLPKHGRACPQCAIKLEPVNVDDVVIDVCPQCGGVWLDHGEYKAACRRSLTMRLHQRAPSLTRKESKAGAAFDRLLDGIVDLHDLVEKKPEEPLLRLGLRPKRR
jgi:Zn-finger nucleic acid-binding protein